MKKVALKLFIGLMMAGLLCPLQAEEQHGDESHSEYEEQILQLTVKQQKMAGIVTEKLTAKEIRSIIEAPGEIMLDSYSTSKVTPRIPAQIIQRHAKMGDLVSKGEPLLTLSSVEMSEAQGELLIAGLDWKRVKKLGRKVVSDKRYVQSKIAFQQAKARARAYGMTKTQIKQFLSKGDANLADGTFQLLAPQAGTVIKDDFILGEQVEVGTVLYVITDESKRWIEARLTHEQADQVKLGSPTFIQVEHHIISGQVIQIRHTLDEVTRRHSVRIAIQNPKDHLHPGLFVTVSIEGGALSNQLVVPSDTLLKSADGNWVLFIEHEKNGFEAREVELLYQTGNRSIIRGIPSGTRVVTQGAFFLQSEQAKSGFDIHNH